MARVARNVVANIAGTAWGTLVGLLVVPVYLRFIGSEGFGLIGFFTLLSSLASILDAGFSAAAAREIARSEGSEAGSRGLRQMVFVLERGFLVLSLTIGALIVALAPLIATAWLNVATITAESATTAVRLMGVTLILQFPHSLYFGCLQGMQRQELQNVVNALVATVRAAGAVLVLWLVSPTVEAFFLWQAVVALGVLVSLRALVWSFLPGARSRPRFELSSVRRIATFAAGMGGVNLLGLALTQIDKVLLSWLLPLDLFGLYILAWTLAAASNRLVSSVLNAVLPRLTQLSARADASAFAALFHQSSQILAALLVPLTVLIAVFSEEILALWTRDLRIAAADRWVVAWLAAGSLLNGLMHIPYAAYVAEGRIRPLLWLNLAGITLQATLVAILTSRWGIVGAAASWAILNAFVMASILLMARSGAGVPRPGDWIATSVLLPTAVSAAFFATGALLLPEFSLDQGSRHAFALGALGIACQVLVVAALPFPRARALKALRARAGGPPQR